MKSADVQKLTSGEQGQRPRKPYIRPTLERIAPTAAKELLLRHEDPTDPEVQHWLNCIDRLVEEENG
jgi:hypothetical protein